MITDRQRSAQADTGHPLLCGKPYELFLVCPQTVYGGRGPVMGGRGCVCVGWGWLSLTLQVERVEHKAHPRLLLWVIAVPLNFVLNSFNVLAPSCIIWLNLDSFSWIKYDKTFFFFKFYLLVWGGVELSPHPPHHRPSNACWEVLCVCVYVCVSVTDTLSSRRP